MDILIEVHSSKGLWVFDASQGTNIKLTSFIKKLISQ